MYIEIKNTNKKYLIFVEDPETPQFMNVRKSYQVGEKLNVSCRVVDGYPEPNITFEIDNEHVKVSIS